jgi:hypothetical protein
MSAVPALAQSQGRSVDVSAQAAMLRLSDGHATNAGFGGRVTFDVWRWVAVDTELSFYPNDDFNVPMTIRPDLTGRLVYNRQRTEGFFGVKVGRRGDRFGVFAKARPGFAKLTNNGLGCGGDVCALIPVFPPDYRTEFAFDLGGIVEFYPSARTVARVDLGDVMINHRSTTPPCSNCTSHNFTSRLGFGFRF